MPHPVDGVYLLVVIAGLLILAGAFKYARWEEWNDRRKRERRAHINLTKNGVLR